MIMIKKLLLFLFASPCFFATAANSTLTAEQWANSYFRAVQESDDAAYEFLQTYRFDPNSILIISSGPNSSGPFIRMPLLGLAVLHNRPTTCSFLLTRMADAFASVEVIDYTTGTTRQHPIIDLSGKPSNSRVA